MLLCKTPILEIMHANDGTSTFDLTLNQMETNSKFGGI